MDLITNSETFTDALYTMALSVLPYMGAAAGAGFVIFVAVLGIRLGRRYVQGVGDSYDAYDPDDSFNRWQNSGMTVDAWKQSDEEYERDRRDDDFYDKGH